MRTPTLGAFAATAVMALAVTGCGSDDDSTSSTSASTGTTAAQTAKVNDEAVALLPADVKSKGTLTVAADASYPPNEFFDKDGKTVIGLDPDLAKALGTALGLKLEVKNAGFDGIIAGLQSGKYDLGMSSFTDNKEREQVVNFVTYLSAGTSFFVNAQKNTPVTDLASLCGLKVAVEKGTVQLDDATAQAKKCPSGKTLSVQPYPDQNGANQALASGRADVSMADTPVADYQVKLSNGALKLAGTPYGTAPYGIAIPKKLKVEKALQAALKGLIADGTYQSILDKWGLEKSAAISDPVINGAQD